MKNIDDKASLGDKRETNAASGKSGIILEYVKALLSWPLIIGALLLVYSGRLMTMVETRETELGPNGVKFGERIETSKKQLGYLDEAASDVYKRQD